MKVTRINWPLVRYKMAEERISSWAALARAAKIHRNTLGRSGPFTSATLDQLGNFFGCDPRELIMLEDAPAAAPAPSATVRAAGPNPRLFMPDTSQIPPDKAQAEAERRAALLAQAAQRTKAQIKKRSGM